MFNFSKKNKDFENIIDMIESYIKRANNKENWDLRSEKVYTKTSYINHDYTITFCDDNGKVGAKTLQCSFALEIDGKLNFKILAEEFDGKSWQDVDTQEVSFQTTNGRVNKCPLYERYVKMLKKFNEKMNKLNLETYGKGTEGAVNLLKKFKI